MKPADKRILMEYPGGDALCYSREDGKHYFSVTIPSDIRGGVTKRHKYPVPPRLLVALGRAILEQDFDLNAPVHVGPDQSDGIPAVDAEAERDTDVDPMPPRTVVTG